MHQIHRSGKKVIELSELVRDRLFTLPRNLANDIDTKTGEPCFSIGINGKWTYLPVGRPTPISYHVFCTIKDMGLSPKYSSFEDGGVMV